MDFPSAPGKRISSLGFMATIFPQHLRVEERVQCQKRWMKIKRPFQVRSAHGKILSQFQPCVMTGNQNLATHKTMSLWFRKT